MHRYLQPLVCLLVLVPCGALAAVDARHRALEEIVVTAQKRERDLQDVALSVSALSGDQLISNQIQNVDDLQFSIPGVTFSTFSANAQLTIRGSGAEDLNVGGDGGSGFHLDGIYQGRPFLVTQSFFDIERVEVLRGPQGTLLGRNNTGGSVNVITNRPDLHRFSVDGDVTIGNYDFLRARAAINLPILEGALGMRVALATEGHDGWLYNETRDEYQEDADIRALRAHIAYAPSDRFDLLLSGYAYRSRGTGPMRQTPNDISSTTGGSPEPSSLRRTRSDGIASGNRPDMSGLGVELDVDGLTGTLEWRIPNMTIRSITGYFRSVISGATDADESDRPLQFSRRIDTATQYSQEVQLISELAGRFDFVLGAFAYVEESKGDLDSMRAILDADGNIADVFNLLLGSVVDTESYALFGEGYLDLADRWRLTVGARMSWDEKVGKGEPLVGDITRLKNDWSEFTPRISLDYRVSDAVMTYVMASRGYKSGGMNTVPAFNSYDPETLWSYEFGVKAETEDRRARINLAAYYNKVKDQHFFRAIPGETLGFTVDNAGKSTIYGVEIEATLIASDNLTLELNAAYTDAEFDEFFTIDPGTPEDTSIISLAGNSLPRTPTWSGAIAVEYNHGVGADHNLRFRAQYRYQSSVWFSHFNERQLFSKQGGYGKADLFATIEQVAGGWWIQGFVRNVFDKDTVANAFRNQSLFPELHNQSFHYAAPPRTLGVTLGYSYGR